MKGSLLGPASQAGASQSDMDKAEKVGYTEWKNGKEPWDKMLKINRLNYVLRASGTSIAKAKLL